VVGALAAGQVSPDTVALLLAVPLLVAGLGGGSVITPNQALSLADVDARGGSTAGGTLQTAQRIGNAIGAAVISAVFYAASRSPGVDREAHYGHAYGLGLAVSVCFGLGAIALAVRGAGRARRARPSDPATAEPASRAG
jgi:hypothetical protein